MEKLVVIPTYNEKDNIEAILRYVFNLQLGYHILVVDDSSPDGTGDIVRQLQSEFPELFLEVRTGKLGLGTAYIHGFKWGLKMGYQYIFEMDADFSHNPQDLDRLYLACKNGADVAVGSRYVRGGKVENWPWDRLLMSTFASIYVNAVLWLGVRDATAGFKCYRAEVLRTIDLSRIRFVGYAFQIEMKHSARQLGFRIAEVPIRFIDRQVGESKMNMGIFREAFLGVLSMRFRPVKPAR